MAWKLIPKAAVPAGLRFDTPRHLQGQTVQVSYGTFGRSEAGEDSRWMREIDKAVSQTDARYYVWDELARTREEADEASRVEATRWGPAQVYSDLFQGGLVRAGIAPAGYGTRYISAILAEDGQWRLMEPPCLSLAERRMVLEFVSGLWPEAKFGYGLTC